MALYALEIVMEAIILLTIVCYSTNFIIDVQCEEDGDEFVHIEVPIEFPFQYEKKVGPYPHCIGNKDVFVDEEFFYSTAALVVIALALLFIVDVGLWYLTWFEYPCSQNSGHKSRCGMKTPSPTTFFLNAVNHVVIGIVMIIISYFWSMSVNKLASITTVDHVRSQNVHNNEICDRDFICSPGKEANYGGLTFTYVLGYICGICFIGHGIYLVYVTKLARTWQKYDESQDFQELMKECKELLECHEELKRLCKSTATETNPLITNPNKIRNKTELIECLTDLTRVQIELIRGHIG